MVALKSVLKEKPSGTEEEEEIKMMVVSTTLAMYSKLCRISGFVYEYCVLPTCWLSTGKSQGRTLPSATTSAANIAHQKSPANQVAK